MRKLNIIVLVLICAALLIGAAQWTTRQDKAHQIANLAREIGLPEDSVIITEASVLWWAEEEDARILANVLAHECPYCSDRQQELTAQVVLNRVADPRFPNTVREVVEQVNYFTQPDGSVRTVYQYHPTYTQNLPEYATANETMKRCFASAVRALMGEVECPPNVIYQSNYNQGTGIYEKISVDTGAWRSVTYFNFG